jgi:hypothetical protein
MTIACMQPYLYPYIGYWQLIAAVDKFIILDDVAFINKGYINRNSFPHGNFNLPLRGASQNKLIKDIEIVGDCDQFFRLLKRYEGAPYYDRAMKQITITGTLISNICYFSIVVLCKYMGVETTIIPSSSLYPKTSSGQERIIDICLAEGATRYINPYGGQHLYDKERFKRAGLELNFLKCNAENRYSIIDLMMHHSPEELKTMLYQYELL